MQNDTPSDRYLLLGEGNFSFAWSLSRWLSRGRREDKGSVHQLVASSFDSEEQVLSKYPEASSVLSQFRQLGRQNLVVHGVDATRPLAPQLSSIVGGGEDESATALFDCIIFNFPHLGVEDAQLHSSMLAHSMACIAASLRDDSSVFVLTLADAQAARWKMLAMAARNRLDLVEALAFRDTDWPGYEIKRHQSGKSFKSRVKDCSYFFFRKASATEHSSTIRHTLHTHLFELRRGAPPPLVATAKSCKRKEEGESGGEGERGEGLKGKQQGKDSKKSKRIFITSTDDYILETLQDGAAMFECLQCQRKFSSEHATRTHIYSLHVLPATATATTTATVSASASASASAAASTEAIAATSQVDGPGSTACTQCDRCFVSSHALAQHCRSVHGKHAPGKPHWAAAASPAAATTVSTTTATLTDVTHECFTCGFIFATEEELQNHALGRASSFQPRDKKLSVPCSTCNRLFSDERSLFQHLNVCNNFK